VADENGREALIPLQVLDGLHHRLLHDHIQRRGWLIKDDHARFEGECKRDRYPLPHSAGQLMWIPAQYRGVEMHLVEQLGAATADFALADIFTVALVCLENVAEVVRHRPDRIEGVHAALQHDRKAASPLSAQVLAGQQRDVRAVEEDLAGLKFRRRPEHARERKAQRRLAASGLADQADEFARPQRQVDVADGPDTYATRRFVNDIDALRL
jgi:hypothetical protein